ncbi:stalk domain-containing protein [Paenibacillus plantiphilus]|uniref:stalk domain-containing protein n=1 Tax=Paenibacillus plantiphilus TaxID=2905650 RepID=UPI001EEA5F7F|nr:stalk domain-containing protein [Paenibacillus plantiphilus]
MKFKLKQKLLLSVLAFGLVIAPLTGIGGASVSAAASAKTAAAQSSALQIYVDGKKLSLSTAPVTQKGVVLVPMRQIFAALNADLSWEPTTKTIIVKKDYSTITLQVGSKQAVINGKSIQLSAPAQQLNGSTMVPLRFVGEALGADVHMDNKSNSIYIVSLEAKMKKYEDPDNTDSDQDEESSSAKKLTTREIVEMNDFSVVMITTDAAQGSGVVIGEKQIITNHHVVESAQSGTVMTVDGEVIDIAGIVVYNEEADLAIIETKEPLNVDPVIIGSGYTDRKGDKVVAIGSPLGFQNTAAEGIISNIEFLGMTRSYQISVPIDHGSSGGGLFNEYGELIGITTSGMDETQADLNFAVSVSAVTELLYELEDSPEKKAAFFDKRLPDSMKGATTDEIKELMKKEFGTIGTFNGSTELKRWEVTRDAQGWLVITAILDPSFYMLYGNQANDDFRYWAIDAGYELLRMMPDEKIQIVVYYEQVFSFEPRGFAPGEVSAVGDGTWRVRYPVIQMQGKEKMHVQVRS